MQQKYFEDFSVGERFEGPSRTLTDAHFLLFSAITGDNHPIHYDDEFAANHPFGRRVTHGLMLAAMTAVGGTELSLMIRDTVVAFLEQSSRFKAPAFIGDTVMPLVEVVECQPKRGGRGLVRFRVSIVRNDGQELLEGEHLYLIVAREQSTAPPTDAS
jgi:acyl dehydratase